MSKTIVLLSGRICSGKTTLAGNLETQKDFKIIKTRELVVKRVPEVDLSREGLQKAGELLDVKTKGSWVAEELSKIYEKIGNEYVVIDSVRIKDQIDEIRKSFGYNVIHIHLTASEKELERRFEERKPSFEEAKKYEDVKKSKTEREVESLKDCADIVIDSEKCSPEDVFVRVAARIGFYPKTVERLVDIVIGGQYGSEGKGHICSYLAPEYDYLVRVGGPNAGHTVKRADGEKTVFQLIPSGTLRAPHAHLIIPPGMVLDADRLKTEILENNIDYDRISIDPCAMIIQKEDIIKEKEILAKISSTLKGVGAATARKILFRHPQEKPILAGDVEEFKHYIRPTHEVLRRAYAQRAKILVEGTQGSDLSIHHGYYPHVTSRDTSVSGCLSEAGISPARVRKIVMACRSNPIRVGSDLQKGVDSGPMGKEIGWETIADRSGYSVDELKNVEKTTNTKKLRRVAEFDWVQLYKSACLNAPTDIAFTFADYLDPKNHDARRFDQLAENTIQLIEEIERVSGAPVSLISTRFHQRSIIDRRKW